MLSLLEKSSYITSVDVQSKITVKELPGETVIRKSLIDNLFAAIFAFLGLIAVIYVVASDKSSIGILTIALALFFIVFATYSLKSLLDRREQLKINSDRILFSDGTLIRWAEVEATYIVRRKFKIRSGLERHYLRIQRKLPKGMSKELAPKIFEITGLQYTSREISHIIESYKEKAKVD